MGRFVTFVVVVVLSLSSVQVSAQYMIGPKVAAMANYHFMYSKEYLLDITNRFNYGYSAGVAMTYKVAPAFHVNIDALYSNKGRSLKGGFNNEFSHIARYHFIDVPVMFRYRFRKTDKYEMFVAAGGSMSYFLLGRGVVESFEYDESAAPPFDYVLKKGSVTEIVENELIIANANDIMVGLNIGFGMTFPVSRKQSLTLEITYQHGHSWLGADEGIDVGLIEYYEDFRTTTSALSLSAAYQFERLIGESRKGKSTYNKVKKVQR